LQKTPGIGTVDDLDTTTRPRGAAACGYAEAFEAVAGACATLRASAGTLASHRVLAIEERISGKVSKASFKLHDSVARLSRGHSVHRFPHLTRNVIVMMKPKDAGK
jgi:hypothetical protein